MGEALAREAPADADIVMPVPETGAPAAAGYAEASGLPYREGMIKNRYAGRTFIQPSQALRQRGVNVKLSPLREQVRGIGAWSWSTTRSCAARRPSRSSTCCAGPARARSTCGSARRPSSTPASTASTRRSRPSSSPRPTALDEIRDYVGADSLSYLSIGGVLDALELPRERFCFACFDGLYPVPVPYDVASHKFILEDPQDEPLAGVR